MKAPAGIHHRGPLAGASAGAAAVVVAGLLVLALARRQFGEVATVIAWALMAAVVIVVAAMAVYVFLWLRHRIRHPETLARQQHVRAEVADEAHVPQAVAAGVPLAAIEPPRPVHLHFHTVDPAGAAEIIRRALPGDTGSAVITEED